MQLSDLSRKLRQSLQEKLPGFDAQREMSPPIREKYTRESIQVFNPRESAVLLLIYPKNGEPHIIFTQRHHYKGVHSGQISLPGGKKDNTDTNNEYTALREAEEEVGVLRSEVEVLGELSWLYVPPSNFIIQPVVGMVDYYPKFVAQETEVKELIEVPLNHLLDSQNVESMNIEMNTPNISFKAPAFVYNEHKIWGATAMILSEFVDIYRNLR